MCRQRWSPSPFASDKLNGWFWVMDLGDVWQCRFACKGVIMLAGELAVWICSRCFDLAPRRYLVERLGSVNACGLTMREADVGESPRFVGWFLNDGDFPFLNLVLSRRSLRGPLGGRNKNTMSIADRVKESINKYNSNDLENALIQTCIAFDGTARNEFPHIKPNAKRFKAFISANMDIITFFTFNTNVFIDCQFNGYTIEQFVYEVLRCGLIHEGELSARFRFTEPGESVSIGGLQWSFPKTFIFGSLLAVIGASSNVKQKVDDQLSVKIIGKLFRINDLWGRGDVIRKVIGPPVSSI